MTTRAGLRGSCSLKHHRGAHVASAARLLFVRAHLATGGRRSLYLEDALGARELGGHYANHNCCSEKENHASGGRRFFAARGNTITSNFTSVNAKQAAHFYQSAVGFSHWSLQRTRNRRERSRQLRVRQNKITFVLTTTDSGEPSGRQSIITNTAMA